MIAVSKNRVSSPLLLVALMLAPFVDEKPVDASSGVEVQSPLIRAAQLRDSHSISRQEILKSIQGKLREMGISEFGELRASDLNIQSSQPCPLADPSLQVKRVRFDALRQAVVFDLWSKREPQFLPFEVTLRGRRELVAKLSQGLDEGGVNGRTDIPSSRRGVQIVHSRPLILAKPGTLATLIMLSQNVRITMAVVPLQPGAKGQSILVRDLSTERVMTAEVVDQNLLQVQF